MRPEYIEAIDSVRYGLTFWKVFLPALLIWYGAIRWKYGIALFFIAWSASWFLVVFHSNRIQSAKERHAQTEEEWQDWSGDTWNTFAPVTAVPYSLVYCLGHAIVAYLLIGSGRFVRWALFCRNKHTEGREQDYSFYRQALVDEYNRTEENE